jgi:hypothetical protein
MARFRFSEKDSSVTASVWGMAERKAIYRHGIGATLVNDFTETDIRKQVFHIPPKPHNNTDSIPWPVGDLVRESLPPNLNKPSLDRAVQFAFNDPPGDQVYTRAVLVVYDSQIVAERYAPEFDRHTVMLGWSVSKSLTGAMIGVLVKAGKLRVDDPAPIPEWANTEKQSILLRYLLQQTSGLDYEENYSIPSTVTRMLFSKGDMAGYAASLPMKDPPGTRFNYSGGNSNLLQKIIRHTVGETAYAAFPYTSLFHRINAYSFLLEPDASGTYIGSSYSYATARDFARFGLLYYCNGNWNGEQILPNDWVPKSIQLSGANNKNPYGFQFWLNRYMENAVLKKELPDVPEDMYYADGYGGQDIYIIPSKKLVVVRLGLFGIDENNFLKQVIQSFP